MNTSFLLGVPGKLKTLVDRLTSARAGYLDNLPTINTNAARLTSARAGYIDYLPTINSRVTAAVATASALATVDSNVDKLLKWTSQSIHEVSGLVDKNDTDTVLSVSGSGTLVAGYMGNGANVLEHHFLVTVDGGSEVNMSTSYELRQGDDDTYLMMFMCNFSTSLAVRVIAGSSEYASYELIYALNN